MKKKFLPLIFGMLLLAVLGIVMAETTTQQSLDPNSSQIIKGTTFTFKFELNGSLYAGDNEHGAIYNVSNVTVQAHPTGDLTTVTDLCSNSTNVNNQTLSTWICQGETQTLEDRLTYVINFSVWNGTSATDSGFTLKNTTTSTAVVVDNTVPEVSLDDAAGITFDRTSSTVTASVTNLSTCFFNFGSNRLAGTINSGRTKCTLTVAKTNPSDGDYKVTIEASDSTNTTFSASKNFRISFASNANVGSQTIEVGGAEGAAKEFFKDKTAIGVIIIIVVVLFMANQNKRRR